jgi:hypothetical protein
MQSIVFNGNSAVKASGIGTDCYSHSYLERYLIYSIRLGQTKGRHGRKKAGPSRLLDLLSLTT